jgi:hypothetical protein
VLNDIFFYMYSSRAIKAFTQAELLELLARSRENNSKLGVTGMLLYKNGEFMQVLEGSEQTVRTLVAKIERDPRHKVAKLLIGYCPERQFPYWYMGFSNLDTEEARNTPGYTEFLNTSLAVGLAADPTLCQRLMHLFKKGAG